MPVYTLPSFNLLGSAWIDPNAPDLDTADVVDVACQFYIYSRGAFDINIGFLELWSPPIYLRLDPTNRPFDVGIWIWEVPSASGRYYRVRWKEILHLGFPNEYDVHLLAQCDGAGVEILRDVVPNPPPEEPPP